MPMNRRLIELMVMNVGTYAAADVMARILCGLLGVPFSIWIPVVLTVSTVTMLYMLKGSHL